MGSLLFVVRLRGEPRHSSCGHVPYHLPQEEPPGDPHPAGLRPLLSGRVGDAYRGILGLDHLCGAYLVCVPPCRGEPGRWWGLCWGRELAGEAHPGAQCLGEAAFPSPCRSHFPFQPSPLVPVRVLTLFLPSLIIGVLDSPYFGYRFIFT